MSAPWTEAGVQQNCHEVCCRWISDMGRYQRGIRVPPEIAKVCWPANGTLTSTAFQEATAVCLVDGIVHLPKLDERSSVRRWRFLFTKSGDNEELIDTDVQRLRPCWMLAYQRRKSLDASAGKSARYVWRLDETAVPDVEPKTRVGGIFDANRIVSRFAVDKSLLNPEVDRPTPSLKYHFKLLIRNTGGQAMKQSTESPPTDVVA